MIKHSAATASKKFLSPGSAPNHKRTSPGSDLAATRSFLHRISKLSKPTRIRHQNLLASLRLFVLMVGCRLPDFVGLFLGWELILLFCPECVVSLKAKLSIYHSL